MPRAPARRSSRAVAAASRRRAGGTRSGPCATTGPRAAPRARARLAAELRVREQPGRQHEQRALVRARDDLEAPRPPLHLEHHQHAREREVREIAAERRRQRRAPTAPRACRARKRRAIATSASTCATISSFVTGRSSSTSAPTWSPWMRASLSVRLADEDERRLRHGPDLRSQSPRHPEAVDVRQHDAAHHGVGKRVARPLESGSAPPRGSRP